MSAIIAFPTVPGDAIKLDTVEALIVLPNTSLGVVVLFLTQYP